MTYLENRILRSSSGIDKLLLVSTSYSRDDRRSGRAGF